ncbi:NAD(P)-binding protein [Zalerion maritima]|uniref:NAD(P)-binding protein n=1 Tax=Zalerion maritima TaxID=339359 RepID=A0AAD5WRU9_9PEZI|nr:NAD(P)-binding protein [Zalerion maritima]
MASSEKALGGKVAMVTGASSGMGRLIALSLAAHGAKVVCCDLAEAANPAGYERDLDVPTASLIARRGGSAIFCRVDISDASQAERAFSSAAAEFSRLDMLVNCAGCWAPFRLFAEEDEGLWERMASVNTLGTARMCRLAVRQFLRQDYDAGSAWGSRGRIVNISSCAGGFGFPGEAAYSATKASVNHLTRAAALDHAKDGINVNCVAPGVVATGMSRVNLEDDAVRGLMEKATPWPRLGNAEDVAGPVVFFCLNEAKWVTGQVLGVDGGMTIGVAPPR